MYNEILKTNELLQGLAKGKIKIDDVKTIIEQYDTMAKHKGNTNYIIELIKGLDILSEVVAQKYLNSKIDDQKSCNIDSIPEDKLLMRKDVIKKYRICPGTFDNWKKRGLKTSTPPGGRRVFVKQSELDRFLLNK